MLDGPQTREVSSQTLDVLDNLPQKVAGTKAATGTDALFQQAGVNASTQPQKVPEKSPTFSRSKFFRVESTGVETKNWRKKELGQEKKDIQFSAEMRDQMTQFLTKHIGKLVGSTEGISTPQILKDFPLEADLIQALTKDGKVDEMLVRNFLETEAGWQTAIQLLEHDTGLKIFASGLVANINPDSVRQYMIDPHTMYLHEDQGWLRHQLSERFFPWLKEPALRAGGRPATTWTKGKNLLAHLAGYGGATSLAGGIAAAGSPVGAGIIVGAEAAGGIVEGAAYSLRNGVIIDLKQCVQTFNVLKNGSAEQKLYLKKVIGIDLDDFKVNAAGTGIEVISGGPGGRTIESLSANVTKNEIYQGLLARAQFYKEAGVLPEVLDSLPEEFLYKGLPSPEQTGSVWSARIMEIYKPNDPSRTGKSIEENIRDYMAARQQAMTEIIRDYLIKTVDGEANSAFVSRNRRRIVDLQNPESTLRKDLIAPETRRIDELTKQKTELETGEFAPVNAYDAELTKFEKAKQEYETTYPDDFSAGPIELAIKTYEDLISTKSTDSHSFKEIWEDLRRRKKIRYTEEEDKVRASIDAEVAQINALPAKQRQSETADWIDRRYQRGEKTVDAEFKREEDELTAEEEKIRTKIAKLKEIKERIDAADKAKKEKEDPICSKAKENLSAMESDFTTITVWGIDESNLRNLTIDEIMARINSLSVKSHKGRWTEAHNFDQDKRAMVINAIAEAKARFEEGFDEKKEQRDKDYGDLTNIGTNPWGLTPAELRNMSRQRLIHRIHQIWVADNTKGWENTLANNTNLANLKKLDDVIFEARNRIILRHNAVVRAKLDDLDVQIKALTKRKESLTFATDVDILICITDAMERTGKTYQQILDVMRRSETYFSPDPISADNNAFTAAEKAAINGEPTLTGYWNMMDMIFGYRERDDRSAYAQKIVKTLPPSELSEYIRDSLAEAGITLPTTTDLTASLTALQAAIKDNSYNKFDFQTMIRNILNGDGERNDQLGLIVKANATGS